MNFGYLNETTGKYYGLEIDIAAEMADRLGYSEVEYVTVTPDTRKDMLLNGEVDCIVATYSIAESREENFDFSEPYYTDSTVVVVEKSTFINSIEELKGLNIGTMAGSNASPLLATKLYELGIIGEEVISNTDTFTQYDGVSVTKAPSYQDLDVLLEQGRVDAACMDRCIAETYMDDDRKFLDTEIADQNYGVATQKDSELSAEVDAVIAQGQQSEEQTTKSFDEIQQSKVASMAFMFRNGVMEGYTEANLQECKTLLDAENVYVLDKEGNILGASQITATDFTLMRYNQLRDVFDDEEASDAFEVETDRGRFRYYGYRIDDNTLAVLEKHPAELDELLASTSTWDAMLRTVTVGLNGFTFAVSDKDYTFLYYPDESLLGMDALSEGISVDDLEDDNYTWMEVNGQRFYCGVAHVEDAFFIMLQEKKKERRKLSGSIYYNFEVGRKIGTVSAIGLVCILLVTFYMQTLFALSQQSISNSRHLAEVEREIQSYEDERESVREQYNERYLNKAQIAAYILTKSPELGDRDHLAELSSMLGVESINVFNKDGVQIATNSPYTEVRISDDPEDQSYEFRKLLVGMEYLIQDAQVNDLTGEYEQYIGVTLRDREGNANGFVQICIEPTLLEDVLENMQLNMILSGIRVGNGGLIFAIDSESGEFVYYPSQRLIGRSASAYGITGSQQTDGYTGYLSIDNMSYYASSLEIGTNYIYIAVPSANVAGNRLPLTIASGIASLHQDHQQQ